MKSFLFNKKLFLSRQNFLGCARPAAGGHSTSNSMCYHVWYNGSRDIQRARECSTWTVGVARSNVEWQAPCLFLSMNVVTGMMCDANKYERRQAFGARCGDKFTSHKGYKRKVWLFCFVLFCFVGANVLLYVCFSWRTQTSV